MIPNSVRITLLVDDYDRAISFYVSQLGLFEVETDRNSGMDRQVALRLLEYCPNFILSLCHISQKTGLSQYLGKQSGEAIFMEFPINDVNDMLEKLNSFGIEIEIHEELPYCEYLVLNDPFGNRLCLMDHFN